MGINFDDFWILGKVRMRASVPDPFAGLRGRAYIAARKLDKVQVQRIKNEMAEKAMAENRENLAKAISKGTASPSKINNFVFASGSVDYLGDAAGRRFFVVGTGGKR